MQRGVPVLKDESALSESTSGPSKTLHCPGVPAKVIPEKSGEPIQALNLRIMYVQFGPIMTA